MSLERHQIWHNNAYRTIVTFEKREVVFESELTKDTSFPTLNKK